jgi:hypothetical protein
MTYHFVARNIGVDSGIILLADKDFYGADQNSIEKRFQKVFKVEPGNYKVQWKTKTLFDGYVDGVGEVNITSGKLVVSDPCYIVSEDKWDKLMEDTNYFKNEPNGTVVLDKMGGDGVYNVEMVLEKV